MTFGFAMLAVGSLMLLSGVWNREITEVLRGVVGPEEGGPGSGFVSALSKVGGDTVGTIAANASAVAGLGGGGVAEFDGKRVCRWMVPILTEARRRGWSGTVTSGYRTPEEQCQACIGVCGNCGGCPGTCAAPGESNHGGCSGRQGAVDVSDYVTFGRIMREMGSPLRNALGPADPVHFSRTGK